MRFIARMGWVVLLVLSVVFLAGFVVTNHEDIELLLWPFSITVTAEVWMFVLGAFALGLMAGALIFWLRGLSLRARLWTKERQINELQARLDRTEQSDDDNSIAEEYGRPV